MTDYAIDDTRGVLTQSYATPGGRHASDVTPLEPAEQDAWLAFLLTQMSEALWRSYTHPKVRIDTDLVVPAHLDARDRDPRAIEEGIAAITNPHLPSENGTIIAFYDPIVESGHALGRWLRRIGNDALRTVIVDEVKAEAAAVAEAAAGRLDGRSQQAAALSRPATSTLQVQAAHDILLDSPVTSAAHFAQLEPVSAAVAAACWLDCAARIVSKATGIPRTKVLRTADHIEYVPWPTPTAVLRAMKKGRSADQAVTELVRGAQEIARGDFDTFILYDAVPDVLRPGPDLLEDLLEGIRACLLVWLEFDELSESEREEHEDDDEYWDGKNAKRVAEFIEILKKRGTKLRY